MELVNVTNKTPIEVALQIDEDGMTTAKKLYEFLELDPSNYAKWVKNNITENVFAEGLYSYLKTSKKGRGNFAQDYRITASLAKKLAMMCKTEKGEQARDYFIGCEQVLAKLLEERHKTELERAKGIAVRQALTKSLQLSQENERMHGHAYSTYTNCIYKALFNKNANQLREQFGIDKKANLRDCFTQEELKAIESTERLVSGLVDCGWGYDQIKDFIQQTHTKMIAN